MEVFENFNGGGQSLVGGYRHLLALVVKIRERFVRRWVGRGVIEHVVVMHLNKGTDELIDQRMLWIA